MQEITNKCLWRNTVKIGANKRRNLTLMTNLFLQQKAKQITARGQKCHLGTVCSGNSKRLNSEQSLISEHFW